MALYCYHNALDTFHGGIKPQNILLDPQSEAILVDQGIRELLDLPSSLSELQKMPISDI